ncbi:DUF3108 domain-containing protein [Variovorax sp. J22P240]|uniref:DUF3108 domain-containing protein n=1 Tax=Variovorax sp. J22P240 TaxID=3053514 RepID=UPI0025770F55|nr:DUF3108 domain-containing protein [Variovorax sp. J22P240]MDM0000003.1 DUF3108 domain-containing protein [Variovorax sp. J22P240]
MPTLASPAASDVPRPPWRALALLTLAVIAAHLALLGVTPVSVGTRQTPLDTKFTTRTIVIAPPPAAAPPAPMAEAKPQPLPTPPRPAPRPPRPAATAPEPTHEHAPQNLLAQNAIDAGEAEAPASPDASDAGTSATGTGTGDSAAAGAAAANEASAANMPGAVPLHIPGSVRLAFAATAQVGTTPMSGVFGELVWMQDAEHYDARLSLTFLFKTLRRWTSTGAIGKTGIEPLRFSDTRKTEVASHFARDQGLVIFSNNTPSVMLLAGAQDRLSVLLQLGALLAGDPLRYPPGSVIAVQTVGPRDAEIWTFNVGEEEQLSVPAGNFTVRKLTRNPRLPFDDKVEVWLSPELAYLPVRLRLTQAGGDFVEMQLREQVPLRPSN